MNHAKGKGYEHSAQYPNTRLTFMGIENIHSMRHSLKAFLQLLARRADARETSAYLSELDKCSWLEHLRGILKASSTVAQLVDLQKASVLVHCSDGWDRTPQITAIAQLLLDASFRSRDGFKALVAKEWLSFGHAFALRHGVLAPLEKGPTTPTGEQLSPVFLQFIDCVWQLTEQFPRAFEFNATYLATLLHRTLSARWGTFSCNCDRQRAQLKLHERTLSAWEGLNDPEYANHAYEPHSGVLTLNLCASNLKPWAAYYCRGAELMRADPLSLAEANCGALQRSNAALRDELAALRALLPTPADACSRAVDDAAAAADDASVPDDAHVPPEATEGDEGGAAGQDVSHECAESGAPPEDHTAAAPPQGSV